MINKLYRQSYKYIIIFLLLQVENPFKYFMVLYFRMATVQTSTSVTEKFDLSPNITDHLWGNVCACNASWCSQISTGQSVVRLTATTTSVPFRITNVKDRYNPTTKEFIFKATGNLSGRTVKTWARRETTQWDRIGYAITSIIQEILCIFWQQIECRFASCPCPSLPHN